jgi:hypothetical protein
MKDVVKVLGQPSQVFTLENRETWEYKNAAYDPVTGRTVRSLDILFLDRLEFCRRAECRLYFRIRPLARKVRAEC